jgi:hypothetical protein
VLENHNSALNPKIFILDKKKVQRLELNYDLSEPNGFGPSIPFFL